MCRNQGRAGPPRGRRNHGSQGGPQTEAVGGRKQGRTWQTVHGPTAKEVEVT